jgi:hypothetical protein
VKKIVVRLLVRFLAAASAFIDKAHAMVYRNKRRLIVTSAFGEIVAGAVLVIPPDRVFLVNSQSL